MTLREMAEKAARDSLLGRMASDTEASSIADAIERVAKEFAAKACAELMTLDWSDGDEIDDINGAISAAERGE